MVAIASDDGRFGNLEGRVAEQSAGIQDIRSAVRELSGRIDRVNARIDRLFLAILGIGAAQIALLLSIVIRNG